MRTHTLYSTAIPLSQPISCPSFVHTPSIRITKCLPHSLPAEAWDMAFPLSVGHATCGTCLDPRVEGKLAGADGELVSLPGHRLHGSLFIADINANMQVHATHLNPSA